MPNDPVEDLLKKIEAYDESEEQFAALIAEALKLTDQPKLADLQRELGRRCGMLPPSTIDRWSRDARVPGPGVRQFALQELTDILVESRSP